MTPVTAAKVKYGVWGLIGGAIIAMIIGFGWGGWTTTRTTKRLGDEAVLAAQAAICVAQFMQQPNPQEKLQELEKVYSYDRTNFGFR
jgi:predicted negative regulator of RcsB-dependent stress response